MKKIWFFLPVATGCIFHVFFVFGDLKGVKLSSFFDLLFFCVPFLVISVLIHKQFFIIPTAISSWFILGFYCLVHYDILYRSGDPAALLLPPIFSSLYLFCFICFGFLFRRLMRLTNDAP